MMMVVIVVASGVGASWKDNKEVEKPSWRGRFDAPFDGNGGGG